MKAFQFIPDKCDLCRKCEEACVAVCGSSKKESGGYVPHIRVLQGPEGPFMRLCKHCEDSPCVDACIGESLQKGPDGLVIQDETRCIGCFMCILYPLLSCACIGITAVYKYRLNSIVFSFFSTDQHRSCFDIVFCKYCSSRAGLFSKY